MGMNQTPASERVHDQFFWKKKAGKIQHHQRSDRAGSCNRLFCYGNYDRSCLQNNGTASIRTGHGH